MEWWKWPDGSSVTEKRRTRGTRQKGRKAVDRD